MENTNKSPQTSTRIEDIQLEGVAFFGSTNNFYFAPDNPVPERVEKFRTHGIGQQMSDGTFDFTAKPRTRAKAILIKKLAHGRLSATCDGGIQLWIRVNKTEGLNIAETLNDEAQSAINYLTKSKN